MMSKRSRLLRMELTGVGCNAMQDLAVLGLGTKSEHEKYVDLHHCEQCMAELDSDAC